MFFADKIGEVSEWSMVLDSKSSVVNSHRGFESHPLRHFKGFMAFTKFRESHFCRFFVKCCGVNNKEAYLDWIKNEKVLNPVLTFCV